ncbi:hypothetical protein [Mycobacterium sp. AZCC_0083]|uniref:hypothetical protein n=1 Tax=Mycobacterium sp. AZCC_0083 TaxID=2735882 RepID=UPI00160EC8F7|nr:hypothetical protein [Mycobacterium sp. AZCC_0083]MBB5167981.1 hypothetical protein [Mycobacterium sp. AZCC_0083]
MFLRKYEQRLEPQLSSELGEPILRCIALHAATMHDRMEMESLNPLWRPSLIVNGQPHTRLPQTMFLVMTPTRVLITDTKRGMFVSGYRPVLSSPILTLLRGDAEMTAVHDDDGVWLYHLKSRAHSAELDLEMAHSGRGIAAELAGQLQEFSVTQRPANPTSGLTAPPEPTVASQLLDNRRRWQTKSNRVHGVLSAVGSLLCFGFGAYQVYGHHLGPFAPGTSKWLFIWGAIFALGAVWLFVPERRRRHRAPPARRGRHAGS